jgi:uncharacterized protein (TIGR02246 family)
VKQASVSILAFFLLGTCVAQQQPRLRQSIVEVTNLVNQLQQASQARDAQKYASLFSEDAKWQGPLGQNAIGPANIKRAVALMLAAFGPLNTREWRATQLGPDSILVEMFQGDRVSGFQKTVPTAPGSATRPPGSSLRTTLVLKEVEGQWRIIDAELADIRMPVERARVAVN